MPIYQEKNKNKLPKNGYSWYFRTYYTDLYGNRKQKQSKMYQTKSLAKDAEREFLNKIVISNETDINILFEKVYDDWLNEKSRKVKSSTMYGIKKMCNKYIYNQFKGTKLHSIKTNSINLWYEYLEKEKCNIKHKNVIISYFKEFLNYASNNYDFNRKVTAKLSPLRVDKIINVKKDSEINFWTYEEFKKFISYVDNDFYYLVFNFLYYTGLRKGELFALNWNDLDFENKKLKINKQCNSKAGIGTYQITTPKTTNSNRIIDIDNELIELLKKRYEIQSKMYGFNNNMFIFGDVKPLSSTTLARRLNYYINKSGIKFISPHGFRHSHVSLLINLGCDSRDVAERIGDTVQIVEKTYYHMFPDKKSSTITLINSLKLRGK